MRFPAITTAGIFLSAALVSGCGTTHGQNVAAKPTAEPAAVYMPPIILGPLAGDAVGADIGRYMDERDRIRTAQTLEYTTTGQSTSWINPYTSNAFAVTPTRSYRKAEGPCRDFAIKVEVGGTPSQVHGTACRRSDGTWKVVP